MRHIAPNPLMSQAVIHNGTATLSGQVDLDNPQADFTTQTRTVLARIDSILAQCGSHRGRLISATIWLTDTADFAQFNTLWTQWLDGATPPARATVRSDLVLPGLKIEIQVTAATD